TADCRLPTADCRLPTADCPMSPDPLHHNLLSAWFDGEATADQAAEAERLIAESPAARREVLEYAQLSMWLRELPAEQGSNGAAEFARIPTNRVRSSKVSATSATHQHEMVRGVVPVSRGKRSAGIAVAFSAAALLVCVGLFRNADRHEAAGLADLDRHENVGEDIAHHAGERRAMEFESAAAPSSAEPLAIAEYRDLAAEAMRRARVDFAEETASFGPSDVLRFRDRPPEVGEVLRFVERSGDEVAIVEVTVLDVQQAAGALEILLERNAISPADEDTPANSAARPNAPAVDDAPSRPTDASVAGQELVAVYVETTDRQFADVLEQMAREPLVVALRTEPVVGKAFVEIPRGPRRTVAPDSLAEPRSADSPPPRPDEATTRTPPAAQSSAESFVAGGRPAGSRSETTARNSVPAPGSTDSKGQALSTAPAPLDFDAMRRNKAVVSGGEKSWQMRLPLPDEAARKLTDKPRGAPIARAKNREGDDARAESAPPKNEGPTPVRALFLLRPR
ncbi:MAG: hypothetical protein WD066_13555, partial [Planctomycetaceae bacterium]